MSCCFVSFSKQFSHKKSIYIAAYVLIVLHFANKRSHDFSVKKVATLISYCLNILVTGLLTLMCCGFTRRKFMVLLCLCWLLIFWVLHLVQVSATSSCTTKGHPVVLSSKKGLNVEGGIVAPTYGCHICPLWKFSEGITYQKFLYEKHMLDIIFSVRTLSSFTQTSSESKKT